MNTRLLAKLFGPEGAWSGPCTVIVDADVSVQSIGSDSIVQGGLKSYSPRLITGRLAADAARLLPEEKAIVVVQKQVIRKNADTDVVQHKMLVVNVDHVAAVEFDGLRALETLGLPAPKLD